MEILSTKSIDKCSFNSLALALKHSACEEMLETATSYFSFFILEATSTIDFAVKSGGRSNRYLWYPREVHCNLGVLLQSVLGGT